MPNEYKPGWEQTMMAEDTFKWMVAMYCARNHSSVSLEDYREQTHTLFGHFADMAMDAAEIFDRKRQLRKFPDMVVIGTKETDAG